MTLRAGPERRPLARFARHGHVAAHHARELAGDGKAQARAGEAAGSTRADVMNAPPCPRDTRHHISTEGMPDTRRTVRTRRSRSIKRTQGPAADRAASQQG